MTPRKRTILNLKPPVHEPDSLAAEKVILRRLLKNAQMQGSPKS